MAQQCRDAHRGRTPKHREPERHLPMAESRSKLAKRLDAADPGELDVHQYESPLLVARHPTRRTLSPSCAAAASGTATRAPRPPTKARRSIIQFPDLFAGAATS